MVVSTLIEAQFPPHMSGGASGATQWYPHSSEMDPATTLWAAPFNTEWHGEGPAVWFMAANRGNELPCTSPS